MSDIHGRLDLLDERLADIDLSGADNTLMLLGDYVDGPDSLGTMDRIMGLQREYGDRVVALMGNHDEWFLESCETVGPTDLTRPYAEWLAALPLWHRVPGALFTHAGIDEEAVRDGIPWEIGTADWIYLHKWPSEVGKLPMEEVVVAGHVWTSEASRGATDHDIWWDGASHIYIDGNVEASGRLNLLAYDPDTRTFWQVVPGGGLEPVARGLLDA